MTGSVAGPSPAAETSSVARSRTGPAHDRINAASFWVERFAALAPPGEVLDLACGSGRHALLFARLGHPVRAADRDLAALAQLRTLAAAEGLPGEAIVTLQVDLETPLAAAGRQEAQEQQNDCHWPFEPASFAAIVVTNYLHRPLLPHIVRSLVPGGLLIYETFAAGNAAFGKPSNPAFLLQPGELLHFAMGSTVPLRIIAFEDGHIVQPAPAMVQRLCAIRLALPVQDADGTTDTAPPAQPAPQQLRL